MSCQPAIEQHIGELSADREVARSIGAAGWVLRNITDQLESFQTINTALTTELATLPTDERARVVDAAAELRRSTQP